MSRSNANRWPQFLKIAILTVSLVLAVTIFTCGAAIFWSEFWQVPRLVYTVLPTYVIKDQNVNGLVVENRGKEAAHKVLIRVVELDEPIETFTIKTTEAITDQQADERNITVWLERIVPARLERWVLYFGLALSVVSAIGATFSLVALNYEPDFFDASLVDAGRMQLPDDPLWVVLLFAVNVAVGVSAVVSLGLRIRGSDRWLDAALVAVLIDLVVGELVAFYAIQFLALTSAFWNLLLLGITIDLRIRAREAVVDDGTTRT